MDQGQKRGEMSAEHTMRIFVSRDNFKRNRTYMDWKQVFANTGLNEFGYDVQSIINRCHNLGKKGITTAADYAAYLAAFDERGTSGRRFGGVRWSPYLRVSAATGSAFEARRTPPRDVSSPLICQEAARVGSQQEAPSPMNQAEATTVVTPVLNREAVARSEVGTQTDPLMVAPRRFQYGMYRRIRKVVPKWEEENHGRINDKEWKKVLERAKHDKLNLLELSAEGWWGLMRKLGISTTKSGRQIRKDFFSHVVPYLRSKFGKVGGALTVGLEEKSQLTMIAIFHRMQCIASNPTRSRMCEVIDKMINEKLLQERKRNSIAFWYAGFRDALLELNIKRNELLGYWYQENGGKYFNTSQEDYENFVGGMMSGFKK